MFGGELRLNLTNQTYVILIHTKRATERYYRDQKGWLKISTRVESFAQLRSKF